MIKTIRIIFFFLTGLQAVALAQTQPIPSSEILHGLKKLNTVGSALYIAAHPDDENTRLLTWLSKEKNVQTAYLSLTRGDGGQNLVGKEQGDALGLLRTHELMAARRIDGAEQFFTRAVDFGYSKNAEETFRIWNKDSILSDVVWTIRTFKPDVIICRFPTTGEGGHGHHTASAILALEAFEAAADPTRFPGQLTHTQTWQAKRVYWNTFIPFGNNAPPAGSLKIDVGGYNSLLGKSYGEIAAESRSMHRSQGFGSVRSRGSQPEYLKWMKGDSVQQDLFEGIDLSWNRLSGTASLQAAIAACIAGFDVQTPEKSIPDLTTVYKALEAWPARDAYSAYWKIIKLKETETLILQAAGLWMEAFTTDPAGIPGDRIQITVQTVNRSSAAVILQQITWPNHADTLLSMALKQNELAVLKHTETLSADLPSSNPYWLDEPRGEGIYTVRNQQQVNRPVNKQAAGITLHLLINGIMFKIERPLVYRFADPAKGEIYRPFEVLPPATVNLSEKAYVFPNGLAKKVQFTVRANKDISGMLEASVSPGWKIMFDTSATRFSLKKGEEKLIEALVTPGKESTEGKLGASLRIGDRTYRSGIRRIEYDHIPYQFMLSEAAAKLSNMEFRTAGTRIGYIEGAGDEVSACLKQAGYDLTFLTDEMLETADLSVYDAIVTGVRAYNTNERLQTHYPRLMEYVKNGGNLVVQYNTNNRIGPLLARIGPYPFTITRNRVTDEHASVRFTDTNHPALSFPNRITEKDFEGWVQERGIYFADELDKNYQTLLSMNDPGEKPLEGSLIVAEYGKGNFVYTGLAFFRQLPAGNSGAYRLFANLLSLPKSNGRG